MMAAHELRSFRNGGVGIPGHDVFGAYVSYFRHVLSRVAAISFIGILTNPAEELLT
jgi:hypothetical protein